MYFVYILLCSDNSFYTGYSDNVEERFLQHKMGRGAKYTKSHKPLKIVYTEKFKTKSEALKREIEIKSWHRQKKIRVLSLKLS